MAAPKDTASTLVAFTLDFETGGLNCQTSACTQIAIHATRLDTFARLGSYVRYIYPYSKQEVKGVGVKRKVLKNKFDVDDEVPMEYAEKALTYSAISMDMLYNSGIDIKTVAAEVTAFIANHTPEKCQKNLKPFLIGQNIDFDKGFFLQMMEYGGTVKEVSKFLRGTTDLYGHWEPLTLDTILLGQLALCHLPHINSYKLEVMCEQLEVELDDAHDADADVSATTNVVGVLTNRLRNANGDQSGGVTMNKTEKSRNHFRI